jgi:hypothetical protein
MVTPATAVDNGLTDSALAQSGDNLPAVICHVKQEVLVRNASADHHD